LSLAQPNPITTKSCHWYRPMPISWIARLRTSALARYRASGPSRAGGDSVAVWSGDLGADMVGLLGLSRRGTWDSNGSVSFLYRGLHDFHDCNPGPCTSSFGIRIGWVGAESARAMRCKVNFMVV
jgi:hypothetical protein